MICLGMSKQATPIVLSDEERETLEGWVRSQKTERRMLERARIVLLAATAERTDAIAVQLRTTPARVSKWRTRFAAERLAALSDRPRSGAAKQYDDETRKRILALLDEPPPDGHTRHLDRRFARCSPRRRQ